jgi:hypothetical protein
MSEREVDLISSEFATFGIITIEPSDSGNIINYTQLINLKFFTFYTDPHTNIIKKW